MIGYFLAASEFQLIPFMALVVGGFLVTGASNGINQIIERDLDKLMSRTESRPLPAGRITVFEAGLVSGIMGLTGVFLLFYFLNPLSGWLGLWALVLYVAFYTPLKRITPIAVFVGAIPGAIPPMLGWVAVTGEFTLIPGILFAVQFLWQFPHFWAIAWKLDDDYSKAGFKLLPSPGGKNKASALQVLIYSVFMVPMSLVPTIFGLSGYGAAIVAGGTSIWFLWQAVRFYRSCQDKDATKVMFASFVYLPVVLLAYLIDKV